MKMLITAILSFVFLNTPNTETERWIIGKESNIYIEGKTNINSFRCDIFEYLPQDTLFFYRDDQAPKSFAIRGGMSIDIKRFDCHQKYITSDLRKTLKADEEPCLKIDLLSIGYFNRNRPPQLVNGWVDIELAGVTRRIDVQYSIRIIEGNGLELTGIKAMLFSDFGLTPPRKLAGLIKVEEQINVRFQLLLHPV